MGTTLTNNGFLALLADHLIAARYSAEQLDAAVDAVVERMTAARIDARIGTLSLDEAAARLSCRNRAQTLATLKKHGIGVVDLGPKKKLVRVADIEAVLTRRTVPALPGGTRIGTTISERVQRNNNPLPSAHSDAGK